MAKFFTIPELNNLRVPWYGRPPIDIWIQVKQFVYQRDSGICQYCGEPTEYQKSNCHHALELSEGGTNHPSNLKTLCINCHKDRHPFMKTAMESLASTRRQMAETVTIPDHLEDTPRTGRGLEAVEVEAGELTRAKRNL